MEKKVFGTKNKYEFIKELGQGSYGKVYLVKSLKPGDSEEPCVLKELNLTEKNQKIEDVEKEAFYLRILNTKYVTQYIDSFKEGDKTFYICMEYCEKGDLSKVIDEHIKENKKFEEDEIVKILIEILLGIGYLHINNIIHRDIKPQNIFISKDGTYKMGDLGVAKKLEKILDPTMTFIGTVLYMGPEIVKNEPYNFKADIWSIGVILYELMLLKHPFHIPNANIFSLYSNIITGKKPELPSCYSEELRSLAKVMLSLDPNQRPNIKEILKYPYLNKKLQSLGYTRQVVDLTGEGIGNYLPKNEEIETIKKYLLEECHLDEKYFDFSNNNYELGWAQKKEKRGNEDYYPPLGWYGIGLNIDTLYPSKDPKNPDHDWVGSGRFGEEDSWAVAYHGLRRSKNKNAMPIKDKIIGIITNGLQAGPHQGEKDDNDLRNPGKKVGEGVYHYYSIIDLVSNKNTNQDPNGYLFVFMCRVNPKCIRQPETNPKMWILNGSKDETRPYRLLFRKAPSRK